jgi:hypothetical protein
MKTITFKNRMNNDRVICDDVQQVQVIDGVEYLIVHRPENQRQFLMRKDVLEKDTTVVKGISRNFAKV